MEGLSQKSLPRGNMIKLATEGRNFKHYVGSQTITANRLYASLTGDASSFLRRYVKWEELMMEDATTQQSLPAVLRNKGYHTAFLSDLVPECPDQWNS